VLVVWAVLTSASIGCGDDQGIVQKTIARMEVSEGGRPVLDSSTVLVTAGRQTVIRIANTGDGALVVKAIELESEAPLAWALSSLPRPSEQAPVTIPPASIPHELTLDFDPSQVPAAARPRATLRIRTNTTLDGSDTFVFFATPESVVPKLVVQPTILDFATVESGTTSTLPLTLLNTGAAPLTISKATLTGDPGFTAVVAGSILSAQNGTAGLALSPPLALAPSSARQVDVTFTSQGVLAARAELVFASSDPGTPSGTRVPLMANLAGPCVRAIPSRLDFGVKLVGHESRAEVELESCGDRALVITALALADDGGGVFALDLAGLGLPLTVAAGARVEVPVSYAPDAVAALGSDGQYLRDRGRLRVTSNAYLAALEVALSGFGGSGACPFAVIEVAEGAEVLPQTALHLTSASTSAAGEIVRWEWSVLAPEHSVSQFFPSAGVAAPSFQPNIVGTYLFRLEVYDSAGNKSCAPAEYLVDVRSHDAIHVELLWRTPGDIDETDEGGGATFSWGSDVDLHFLHPLAAGQFFDDAHDCYWKTPLMEWGPVGPAGDPRLDRDDRDGGGPENLNMATPEDGMRYQVGVHYYNDWGYGGAFATVRVYIYGVLRDQSDEVGLVNADLWESHAIEWPSGRVVRVTGPDGLPKITSGYPIP